MTLEYASNSAIFSVNNLSALWHRRSSRRATTEQHWSARPQQGNTTVKPPYTLEALSQLADVPPRRIRFYIQQGVVSRPNGVGRGAHYDARHLEQLLEVRRWQEAGLSLERIRELINPAGMSAATLPPPKPRVPGSVEVWTRVLIDQGVELHINSAEAGLSAESARRLNEAVIELYSRIKREQDQDDGA